MYKLANKEAKRIMSKVNIRLAILYMLNYVQKGDNDIYRLVKIREMEMRDLRSDRCVKDEDK